MVNISKVVIDFVPHNKQRYDTTGDWYFDKLDPTILHVVVSQSENPAYHSAVAIHEMFEAMLCNLNGVTEEQVDNFDMGEGAAYGDDRGSHPDAPYGTQHRVATMVENMFILSAGISMVQYETTYEDSIIHGDTIKVANDNKDFDPLIDPSDDD